MTKPVVKAISFQNRLVEVKLGDLEPEEYIVVAIELSNGRTLLVDDYGIIDQKDLDVNLPIPEQQFFYLSWDEALDALDLQRQEGLN